MGATEVEPACTFTLSTGYKPEGIRPGWPPRSRTERYRLIRSAPSTGWVVTNRKVRVSSPTAAKPSRVFKARCRAGGAPSRAESGELESQRVSAHPRSKRSPQPWRVLVPETAPRPGVNRQGMAEDGEFELVLRAWRARVLAADTTVTWSLSPVPTRAVSSYQELADADPKGIEHTRAATRGRTGPSAVRRRSRKPCAAA